MPAVPQPEKAKPKASAKMRSFTARLLIMEMDGALLMQERPAES